MAGIRINRYMASSGAISRRKADELIEAGRVRINGKPARLGDVIDPARDEVRLDGRPLTSQRTCILALYKPRYVLTTMSDPKGRPCIRDLIPRRFQGVFPVGRLDYDAEGLLILTNDGDLAHAIHHPSFQVPKVYVVKVTPRATAEGIARMEQGVVLDGKKTLPARIDHVHAGEYGSHTAVHPATRAQEPDQAHGLVRGSEVVSLKRISIGPLVLKGMAPGEIRELSALEARSLHKILKNIKT
jgi:23S rRNA pseudouridine2605 synthase